MSRDKVERFFSKNPFICTRPCITEGCASVQILRGTEDIFGRPKGNVWVCLKCRKWQEEVKDEPR